MERLIRNVTKKFTSLLPENKPFFTPDDLRKFDIPEFLVQRIEVEIYRNLNESIVPPHSEWADMTAPDVKKAWERFINAIVAEVRMPASFAASVFETSVADVAELILQPRTAIPSILYGPETKLSKEELQKRRSFITVNTHLADAVLKYMERKEKEMLTITTCESIVEQVDIRLTQNYNSLNWAQLFQPLFILTGPRVDSELVRIFFESRNMKKIARRFDLLDDSVDKTKLIEILSSPDLLNDERFGDEESSLLDSVAATVGYQQKIKPADISGLDIEKRSPGEQPVDKDPENEKEEKPSEKPDVQKIESADSHSSAATNQPETEEDDDTLLASFQSRLRGYHEVEDDEISKADEEEPESDSDLPLHSLFGTDEDIDTEPQDEEQWKQYETSDRDRTFSEQFYDQSDDDDDDDGADKEKEDKKIENPDFNEPEETPVVEDEPTPESEEADIYEDEIDAKFLFGEEEEVDDELDKITIFRDEIQAEDENNETGERPIWQSFLSDDEHINQDDIKEPEYSAFSDQDEDDEPVIDLSKIDEDEPEAEKLIGWLANDEKRFTESIFSGSNRAYEQALVKLDDFDSWKQASNYIENEIFARNFIDMYDDDAVDFTDRMQAYFDQFKP